MKLALLAVLIATPAVADLSVRFDEGAPKDRFTLTNTSDCTLAAQVVTIDLSPSQGGLVFDVTGQGAGIEVFQPFEIVSGDGLLQAPPVVRDGDTRIDLPLAGLAPGASVAFTIDVDDTVSARGITVSGAEIAGAKLRSVTAESTFDTSARADLPVPDCLG